MRILVLGLLAAGLLASPARARIWTDATGQAQVDAEYLGVEDGQVKIQFRNGTVTAIPLGTLSEADQQFVKEQIARAEAEREAAAGPPDRLTQRVKDDPTNPDVYIERGMARINRKDYDGAIRDFTKALEFNSEDAYAYNGRGLAYQKKNELVAAQTDFNTAIQLEPDLPSAYRNRGENLRKLSLDKNQSVPELDHAIERWQQFWNHARKSNLKRAPWQPLNATKGDVSRHAALQQMAKIDLEYAERLERDYGWHGDGGDGGHGHGCSCEGCSGTACPHCDGSGCPACGGGKPAPGLGVYPPECMKGETITLVANASQLAKGMPAEAKPGAKPDPNAPKIDVDSVDFYRDVDGDGLFNADNDQFLAADANQDDGFSAEVATEAFPPGPQSYFAVPRGAPGTGTGATPEELLAAAETMKQAAQTQRGIAQACESGKAQGLSADQSKSIAGDQEGITEQTQQAAEKVAAASPEIAELLEEATSKPMKAVKNLMNTAQKQPGEACKDEAEKASDKANEAADKLAEAATKLQEAYEAAKASAAGNPGQAPANAASGRPTSGANEILAAAPIGPRGVGGGDGNGGDGDDDDYEDEIVIERALDYIEEEDYDNAIVEYDTLLEEDPNNAYYLRDRAATNLLRGGYVDAIEDYNRLLEVKDEPDADLYYNRGCAHMAAGRLQEAISDFTKSISLNETWSLAYNNRGVTYARLKDYSKAIEDFTAAIQLEAGNKLAYRNRALAYRKLGEMRKAQADYDFVVKLEQGADSDPFQD